MNTRDWFRTRKIPTNESNSSAEKAAKINCGFVQLSSIEERSVDWLWEGFLPVGKLVVLEGDPDSKKTYLTTDFAARVANGDPFPDEQPRRKPGNVLLLNREDAPADTIRPRVRAACGDLGRVFVLPTEGPDGYLALPSDISRIRQACIEMKVRLVIIDPVSSFATSGMSCEHRAREILDRLSAMAMELNVTVIVVRHLTKAKSTNKLYRGMGSIGVTGAARAVLTVEQHPKCQGIMILTNIKGNVGGDKPCIGFTLVGEPGKQPRIAWHAEITGVGIDSDENEYENGNDDDFPSDTYNEQPSTVERAKGFLNKLLANGGVPALQCIAIAKQNGISEPTLRRAKKLLGIGSPKDGRRWEWKLLQTPHLRLLPGERDQQHDHLPLVLPPGPEVKALPLPKAISEADHLGARRAPRRKIVWKNALITACRKGARFRRWSATQGDHHKNSHRAAKVISSAQCPARNTI